MSDIGEHVFDPQRDLPELLAMVGRARATSDPHAFLHTGGLQWLLRRLGRETFAVLRWTHGDAVAGFGVDDGGYVMIQSAGLRWIDTSRCSIRPRRGSSEEARQ